MRTVPGCGCFFGIIFIPYTSGSIPALAISAWFPPIPFFLSVASVDGLSTTPAQISEASSLTHSPSM